MRKILIWASCLSVAIIYAVSSGHPLFAGSSCDQQPVTSLPPTIQVTFQKALTINEQEGGINMNDAALNQGVGCSFTIGDVDQELEIPAQTRYSCEWIQADANSSFKGTDIWNCNSEGVPLTAEIWCSGSGSKSSPITVGQLKTGFGSWLKLETSPPGCQK